MEDVRYEAPESPDAAISLLAEAGSSGRVFAGGTDVMVQIHAELIDPGVIVDIKKGSWHYGYFGIRGCLHVWRCDAGYGFDGA